MHFPIGYPHTPVQFIFSYRQTRENASTTKRLSTDYYSITLVLRLLQHDGLCLRAGSRGPV